MALSFAHHQGTGAQTTFEVSFEYLAKAHVKVKVDGVPVTPEWLSTYTIKLTPAPANGAVIELRRETPRDERLVNFSDGSTLVQSDLNTDSLQTFFLAQEAYDLQTNPMVVGPHGDFEGANRRIRNLGYPVLPTDAATRQYVLDAQAENLDQINSALEHADEQLDAIMAERAYVETQRVLAQAARTGAEASREGMDELFADTVDARNAAQSAQVTTAQLASQAATSASQALTHRNAVEAGIATAQGYAASTRADADEVAANASLVEGWKDQASASEAAAQTYANSAHSERLQVQDLLAEVEGVRDAAQAAWDEFDDKYLGAFPANPTVDNDGEPLADGAVYWSTTTKEWRVYDLVTTSWFALAATTNSSLITRTPTATLVAANVADALNELDTKKAPLDSPTFSGTVGGITKAMVGLNNVNNTADENKPVSIATQAALDLKATTAALTSGLAGKANTTHQHAATDITSGTLPDARLPVRLGIYATTIADCNLAVTNGWWMGSTMANSPATDWLLIHVEAHNNLWCTQTAHAFGSSNARWRRELNNGTWGAWYPLLSEAYTVSTSDPSGSAIEGTLWFKV